MVSFEIMRFPVPGSYLRECHLSTCNFLREPMKQLSYLSGHCNSILYSKLEGSLAYFFERNLLPSVYLQFPFPKIFVHGGLI